MTQAVTQTVSSRHILIISSHLHLSQNTPHNIPCRQRGWGVEIQLRSFLTSALDRGKSSTPRPGRLTPGKDGQYPLPRWLVWPRGRSESVPKTSPPPAFDSRRVQPLMYSLYRLCYPVLLNNNYFSQTFSSLWKFLIQLGIHSHLPKSDYL